MMMSKQHGSVNSALENHDSGMASKDSIEKSHEFEAFEVYGKRAVQVLAIRANFPVLVIYGFDCQQARCIYMQCKGEVQEVQQEGMVDLVPRGPGQILVVDGYFVLKVYADESDNPIFADGWNVEDKDEIHEYTQTFYECSGRKFEITYLVIPSAIEAKVEVKLKLKDLGSRSRAVYGKIKASATEYGNQSVHLFSCDRGTSLSFPCGSTSILKLSPTRVAVPCHWQLELHIEVDLTVITTRDNQEEQDKNLKFTLEFTREIRQQEREVDGDIVEVNIEWNPIW